MSYLCNSYFFPPRLTRKHFSRRFVFIRTAISSVVSKASGRQKEQQPSGSVIERMSSLFINPLVNATLYDLFDKNPANILRMNKLAGAELGAIDLMSDDVLHKAKQSGNQILKQTLQIPPILAHHDAERREKTLKVLQQDPLLKGLLPTGHKLVFSDISLNKKMRNRLVLVRDSEGRLREIDAAERNRVLGVYYPIPGRKPLTPKLFLGSPLQEMLNNQQHIYVLDRACIQFEPFEPTYIEVTLKVFEDLLNGVRSEKKLTNYLDLLSEFRCTRHFGGLTLYGLVVNEIFGLFDTMMQQMDRRALTSLIQLHMIVHPQSTFVHSIMKPPRKSESKMEIFQDICDNLARRDEHFPQQFVQYLNGILKDFVKLECHNRILKQRLLSMIS